MSNDNMTERGRFHAKFPRGQRVIVKTPEGKAVAAQMGDDGNAWTEHGDAWVHPLFGDKGEAVANSRRWGIAVEFYPFNPFRAWLQG